VDPDDRSLVMSVPLSAADVLADVLGEHVAFELECIDRVYCNAYVPKLAYPGGVATFFEHAAEVGAVEHLRQGELGLQDRELIAVAAAAVSPGEWVRQPRQPAAKERVDLRRRQTVQIRCSRSGCSQERNPLSSNCLSVTVTQIMSRLTGVLRLSVDCHCGHCSVLPRPPHPTRPDSGSARRLAVKVGPFEVVGCAPRLAALS